MVFSSHLLLFYFLPGARLLYYAMPRRGKHLVLTLLSYLFYGWANPLFVVLMLTSTSIDYVCGLVVTRQFGQAWGRPIEPLEKGGARGRGQLIAPIVSICSNLSLLGFFKYFNFATESYDGLMALLGLPGLERGLAFRITLPLVISFYTFQSMSYSIDSYRGDAKPIRNFVDFACYVSMFPQLVAGPIVRFQEVAQLEIGQTGVAKVRAPAPVDVYQTARHRPHRDSFKVPNGDYLVRLHFSDEHDAEGKMREMNFVIENRRALQGFNVAAAGGTSKAVVREFPVTVADGNGLQIVGEEPKGGDVFASGIEILSR